MKSNTMNRRRGRPLNAPDLTTPRGRVGAAIRAARLAAGLTVKAAAAACEVASNRWYSWECGRSFPPFGRVSAIADALGCEIADLIPEAD